MPTDPLLILAASALGLWGSVALLPWQPWRNRETLEAEPPATTPDLSAITALIPARDEAGVIAATLTSLAHQGEGLRIILIDDGSGDGTADVAAGLQLPNLQLLQGEPLPAGWVGKLWALEQGRRLIDTPYTLLLDADIALAPGTLSRLHHKLTGAGYHFVSLLAAPSLHSFWERLLMPAFVFFFKLLYPFALANRPHSPVAAAAGGCVLMESRVLDQIGGFAALRQALIDDCTLARRAKQAGFATWLGLTHAAQSQRPYAGLAGIWQMVARTAFTQLRYSPALLLLCTLLLGLMFSVPPCALLLSGSSAGAGLFGGSAWLLMAAIYRPTLRYYRLHSVWGLALPVIGLLFLAMTWTSAIRYWRGQRSSWKGRDYTRDHHAS